MHSKSFLSAAKSSCKFAIGSPLHARTPALNGNPAAACGYTSTPCGVCLLSILKENIYVTTYFVREFLYLHFYIGKVYCPTILFCLKSIVRANIIEYLIEKTFVI